MGPGQTGRLPALTPEEIEWMRMVVNDRFTKREPIGYADLLCEIELEFDNFLLQDWPVNSSVLCLTSRFLHVCLF
jgi:hypothetical protein